MPQIYEGMFLIDNDTVRAGWAEAKAVVTDALTKHGATIHCARRWDERHLAYPIRRKGRATYLLAHYEMPAASIPVFLREVELREPILRHLQVKVDAVPESERRLAEAEQADDFAVPEPPPDEVRRILPELEDRPPPVRSDSSALEAPERTGKAKEVVEEGDAGAKGDPSAPPAEKAGEDSPEPAAVGAEGEESKEG